MNKIFAATALALFATAPATADQSNPLTNGMVQMTLRVGTTTQAEVLEVFGAPNVSTIDGNGQEVWAYDRFATVTQTKDSGFSIGILGGAGGGNVAGGAGLGFGSSKSKASTSTRSMTLIIKFGPDHRVVDFKSRSSSF